MQAKIAALMLALSVASYFDRTIMSITGPYIIREFSLSETEMGSVYSAFVLSYALLMIPGGHLADRLGPRLVLAVVGVGSGLFTGLTALGGRPGLGAYFGIIPSFLAIRLGLGAFTAPLYPSCARMNAMWFPAANRARVWGLVAAGAGLGGAASPVLFSWMIGRFGWRASFWAAGFATTALGLVWFWQVRDRPEEPSLRVRETVPGASTTPAERPRGVWRRLLTDRNLLLLTLSYATVGYFEYIFFFWMYYYFGEIRGMGPGQSAIYTTALFLTWTVATPLGGWISDRLTTRYGRKTGRRIVPLAGLTAGAVLLFVGTGLTEPIAVAAVLSVALGCASASDGSFWSSAIDLGGKEVGAACGILNAGSNVGGSIAPVLTPWIASFAGWTWGLYLGCLVVLAGVAAWLFIDPSRAILSSDGRAAEA
jgi:ACS family glucarate transporter-like MFS transporter